MEEYLESTGPESRVFGAFLGALKGVGFYPEGNPVRDQLVGTLADSLKTCAVGTGGVSIGFRPEDVQVAGVGVVSRNEEGWETAVRLYEAGLRNLTFLSEVTPPELLQLLQLLARTVRGELNPTDEDLSVLLWEMDLPAVAYSVIDPAEEGDAATLVDSGAEEPTIDPEMWEGIHPLERYLASAGGLEDTDLDPRTLRVEDVELETLRSQAKQEGRQLRPKLLMVLTEMLLADLTPVELDQILTLFRGYSLDLLQQGRFRVFMRAMSRLRQRKGEVNQETAEQLSKLERELAGEQAAQRAMAALESDRCDDPEVAVAFLGGLRPSGLAVLLDSAAEVGESAESAHRAVSAQALSRAIVRRPEMLFRNAGAIKEAHLNLLAQILPQPVPPEQAEELSRSLGPLLGDPDPGVRAGVLRFLTSVRPPDLEKRILQSLDDPDSHVRRIAARLLSERFGARALQPLLQVLLSPGFEKREYEEQAAIYEALAQCSPEEMFPLLEKTVSRRNWLAPRHWRIQKACALRALGAIPIEKAGALLMRHRDSRDALLAEASRQALENHRQRLQAGGEANGKAA